MRPIKPPNGIDFFILILLSVLWASSFSVMKFLVADLSPSAIAILRTGIGSLIIFPFMFGKPFPKRKKEWFLLFGIAIFSSALPFTLIPWGETQVDSGLAGMLMSMGPVFALGLNHFFTTDDRITSRKLIGVAFGISGTTIIFGESIFAGQLEQIPYILFILLACISYVFSGLLTRYLGHLSTSVITGASLLMATCVNLPFVFLAENPFPATLSPSIIVAILYLGIFPTGGAFFMRFFLIKRTGYMFFSYIGYIIPALTLAFGAIFLSENLSLERLSALILIIIGLSFFRVKKHV